MTAMAQLGAMAIGATVMASAAGAGPLKVYILAGQSNMQGHARVATFEHIGMDPRTAPMLGKMVNADGTPKVCDKVWISALGCSDTEQTGRLTAGFGAGANGPKIGPEFTFGIYMQELVNEPILIIKTAWGGKSLNTDFRPPSAGPYEFNEQQLKDFSAKGRDLDEERKKKAGETGVYYRLMIEHVKKVTADIKRVYPEYDEKAGYELAGFVWFQGWNDMVDRGTYPNRDTPGGYKLYTDLLVKFIQDVRQDLSAPNLPFVIGVMGVGGDLDAKPPNRYTPIHKGFREAMAAAADLPGFKGNVVAVRTEKCWDPQLTELQERGAKVKEKETELKKDKNLTPEQVKEAVEKYRAGLFTPQELEIMKKGISNAEFHYLGSAKILGGIGKAFAEALAGLQGHDGTERR